MAAVNIVLFLLKMEKCHIERVCHLKTFEFFSNLQTIAKAVKIAAACQCGNVIVVARGTKLKQQ